MQNWEAVELAQCADFQEGYVNPSQGIAAYFDGPIKWLRAVDLNDGLVTDTSRTLTMLGFNSAGSSALLFEPGSLAISKSGTIGRVGILGDYMCGNRAVINIKPRKAVCDSRFLFYSLLLGRPDIEVLAEGSVQRNLYVSALSRFRLKLPPLQYQKIIASVLGALDEKIELNRRKNETLEAMARAIFRDWFVDFGPTRAKMEGRPPYLAPDLWSMFPDNLDDEGKPEGWGSGNLGDVAAPTGTSVDPQVVSSDTPYIGLEHMPRRSIALSEWEHAGKVSSGKTAFRAGDLLFGKLRPYFHKVGIAPIDGICSTDIVVISPKQEIARAFVLCHISDDAFVAFTDRTSDGTKMPRTSWERMARYDLIVPSMPVVAAFDDLVGSLLAQISSSIHEVRLLAATRDLLLPRLLSGELYVRPDSSAEGLQL